MKANCPFCNGDLGGCCFCDHSGEVEIGEGKVFKTLESLKPFQKEYIKESDLKELYKRKWLNSSTHE